MELNQMDCSNSETLKPTSPCPFSDCKEVLYYSDVLQHLKLKHNLNEKESSTGEAEIPFSLDDYCQSDPKSSPRSHILACHGKRFLICMFNSQHHLQWAILLIGNEADEKRYSGEIILKLEEKRDVRWTFPIVSIFNLTAIEYVLKGFGSTGMYPKQNIHQMCSTGAELKVTFKITTIIPTLEGTSWVACSNGSVPSGGLASAVGGGKIMYVIRAQYKGSVLPGHLTSSHRVAYFTSGGHMHHNSDYEVLVVPAELVTWIKNYGGTIPENAIPGGKSVEGELLYIGRPVEKENLTIGGVHPIHGCLYVDGHRGGEVRITNYEILVLRINSSTRIN